MFISQLLLNSSQQKTNNIITPNKKVIIPNNTISSTPISLRDIDKRELTDRTNPKCVFHDVIGQNGPVELILDKVYNALGNPERLTRNNAILFYGSKSTGKTLFAKLLAKSLMRPFIEADANIIKNTDDVFALGYATAKEIGKPMEVKKILHGKKVYEFPNLVYFIDEIHGLNNSVVVGLLKAFESTDKLLTTRKAFVDCTKVLWIGATTERGTLFDAFESRFDKIFMNSYTLDEIARIVQLRFPKFDMQICLAIAKQSGLIARQALDLANDVDLKAERHGCSKFEALNNVTKQQGLDESGFSKQQIWVLQALAQTPNGLNYDQLCRIAQCKVEELKEHVLPKLLMCSDDQAAFVTWNGKNSRITKEGLEFLKEKLCCL
jgi:Holliday junction resolvasome RuvABC ATP-dependent DNA helicase subunit